MRVQDRQRARASTGRRQPYRAHTRTRVHAQTHSPTAFSALFVGTQSSDHNTHAHAHAHAHAAMQAPHVQLI